MKQDIQLGTFLQIGMIISWAFAFFVGMSKLFYSDPEPGEQTFDLENIAKVPTEVWLVSVGLGVVLTLSYLAYQWFASRR